MADRHIEMTWVCAACSLRNLGRHTGCQRCGKAKTTEAYEMPAEVSQAASVTDPELLRLATAGANWVCRYCGSDQRRLDGECARCGGERTARERQEHASAGQAPRPAAPGPVPGRSWSPAALLVPVASLAIFGLVIGLFLFARRPAPPPTVVGQPTSEPAEPVGPVPGSVVGLKWEQRLVIERYQILPGEGFAEQRPADALDVKAAGTHVHHIDQVPDGYREETYTETVPDGTRTESYTEQTQCGQDCRSTPQSCRQVCTSSKNGFANCKDVCSGGGQTCSPKYCSQTRTRQVPKTRTVTRTRQVPRTRPVERLAPWFTWRAWGWKQDRVLRRQGDAPPLAWPADAEADAGPRLGKGEQERASKQGDYSLTLSDRSGKQYEYHPTDGAQLSSLHAGSQVTLHLAPGGRVESVETAP
jgi:hypothetical protein